MYDKDVSRGGIKFPDRYKQLISYEGMVRRRRITPTDIDGFIDYNGVSFIYIEGKLEGKSIDYGQRKALEHSVNSHVKAGHHAVAIIFRHNSKAEEIIMAKDKNVSEIYFKYEWRPPDREMNVLMFVEAWERYMDSLNVSI